MSEVVIKKRRPTTGTEIGIDDLAASAASVEYFDAESELDLSGDTQAIRQGLGSGIERFDSALLEES